MVIRRIWGGVALLDQPANSKMWRGGPVRPTRGLKDVPLAAALGRQCFEEHWRAKPSPVAPERSARSQPPDDWMRIMAVSCDSSISCGESRPFPPHAGTNPAYPRTAPACPRTPPARQRSGPAYQRTAAAYRGSSPACSGAVPACHPSGPACPRRAAASRRSAPGWPCSIGWRSQRCATARRLWDKQCRCVCK